MGTSFGKALVDVAGGGPSCRRRPASRRCSDFAVLCSRLGLFRFQLSMGVQRDESRPVWTPASAGGTIGIWLDGRPRLSSGGVISYGSFRPGVLRRDGGGAMRAIVLADRPAGAAVVQGHELAARRGFRLFRS